MHHKKGDVAVVDNNEAFGLIDSGVAIITKDITLSDYQEVFKTKKAKK